MPLVDETDILGIQISNLERPKYTLRPYHPNNKTSRRYSGVNGAVDPRNAPFHEK